MSGSDRVPVVADGDWSDDVDAEEGVVVNWFATEGRRVEAGESLCEIQIEKVSVDVLAPVAGELAEIARAEDAEFAVGDTLAWIAPD
ncbi:lipoyl domain-containing protein [Haloplanus halophilus]|uniref:lipoyl domain-containing protein n=1 Tax=Haloplanus halophilus TaxID=2949993 RepID=UPI00203DE009|nr:lipoyl domain-containing protein [Haloplanus sp. GDY1]